MSPPRATSLSGVSPDLTDRILDSIETLHRELAEVRSMLERRLTTIDDTAAKVVLLETRVLDLEKTRARGEGALWAGRIAWLGLGAAGAFASWLTGLFRPHP